MKFKLYTLTTFVLLSWSLSAQQIIDSVSMGNGYVKDVYYHLTQDEVGQVAFDNWDIAVTTRQMSAAIMTNDVKGVELYAYPKSDYAGWDNVDTTGLHLWARLINDESDWEMGAFNRNSTGHPNYGWGVYNATTHDVVGDSLFILKTAEGTVYKFAVLKKLSILNKVLLRYSRLDGSDDTQLELNAADYPDVHFAYYSLGQKQWVDHEPAADWELLFTRYMSLMPMGPQWVNYPVAGILLNTGMQAVKVVKQEETTYKNWAAYNYYTEKNVIGYDWKSFDMATMSYKMADSTLYFVKTLNGDIYKVWFNGFESGAGDGLAKFKFYRELISVIGVDETSAGILSVYPNPASHVVTVVFDSPKEAGVLIELFDINGRRIALLNQKNSVEGMQSVVCSLPDLVNGLYLLKIQNGNQRESRRLMINQ